MIQRLNNTYHKKVIEYLYREKEVNIFLISDIERYGYDSYFFSIYGGINKKGEIEGLLLKCFEFIIFYAYDEFDVDEFASFINESDCEEVCCKSEVLEKLEKKIDLKRFRKVNIFKLSNLVRNIKIKKIVSVEIKNIIYYIVNEVNILG